MEPTQPINQPAHNHEVYPTNPETFHLGITMAGAVSAGCYTGGVMDYLFEALDNWEKAKDGKLKGLPADKQALVPQHKVVIDAMGGTSAGGMTTVMAAYYALKNKINPVKSTAQAGKPQDNIFYDSWVNLIDQSESKTIQKAMAIDDLKDGRIKSLLNSSFIDQIARKALDAESLPANYKNHLPGYISAHLELLITHTMLQGIPLTVQFTGKTKGQPLFKDNPGHSTFEHMLFSHFKLMDQLPADWNEYIPLELKDKKALEHLTRATIATGAFPLGLQYRNFDASSFSEAYLKNSIIRVIERNLGKANPQIEGDIVWHDTIMKQFASVSVDGGAVNNEPYGEVMSILKHRYHEPVHSVSTTEGTATYQKYGVVMIDPFPDFAVDKPLPKRCQDSDAKEEKPEHDLLNLVPKLIGTIWNQAKVKRHEMVEQYDTAAYRAVVYPVKNTGAPAPRLISNYDEYALASGALGAFGGFLDIQFRHHDFFLGRDNARSLIRKHLSLPYDEATGGRHPIHKNWSKPMINQFKYTEGGKTYLPIIPDMTLLLQDQKADGQKADDPSTYYTVPQKPVVTMKQVKALLAEPMRQRLCRIIDILVQSVFKGGGLFNVLVRIAVFLFRKRIANKILNLLWPAIAKQLRCYELLKE